MSNFSGIPLDDIPADKNRDDIRTVSLSLQYLFALNYDKFSLKASFINNEMQRKSAGSFLVGAQFHLINIDADSSIVPVFSQGYFDENLHLTSATNSSALINFGYMYTFVWRENFYFTVGFIPGIGLNIGDFKTDIKKPLNSIFTTSWSSMNAIGYNSRKAFGGIQIMNDAYYFRMDKGEVMAHGNGKMKIYIGYRF